MSFVPLTSFLLLFMAAKLTMNASRRFCGNVAPPTVNTNSSTVWVTFRSDGTIAGSGFAAQYRALLPAHSQ